jgi:hypothetical protein
MRDSISRSGCPARYCSGLLRGNLYDRCSANEVPPKVCSLKPIMGTNRNARMRYVTVRKRIWGPRAEKRVPVRDRYNSLNCMSSFSHEIAIPDDCRNAIHVLRLGRSFVCRLRPSHCWSPGALRSSSTCRKQRFARADGEPRHLVILAVLSRSG